MNEGYEPVSSLFRYDFVTRGDPGVCETPSFPAFARANPLNSDPPAAAAAPILATRGAQVSNTGIPIDSRPAFTKDVPCKAQFVTRTMPAEGLLENDNMSLGQTISPWDDYREPQPLESVCSNTSLGMAGCPDAVVKRRRRRYDDSVPVVRPGPNRFGRKVP
jgi:hypothetical protein